MSTISLREYLRHIDDLIDRGHLDEAVAHCRHILKHYPKALAVYRLLGKAYLEAQRYDEAADLFRRVLAAAPDDLVAHAAMSAIAEAKGDLDMAIAHMEQAFEADPSNTAVQEELRRLYGLRDGVEPPRIRLTRGALARMYYLGQLYPQAIAELRAALSEDPERPSLQLLLAKTYAAAGKFAQAVETCAALLKKRPYCLEANRLMAELLTKAGREEEARRYLQRVQALDPYMAYVGERWPTPESVPDEQVTLEMMEWVPEMAEGEMSLTGPVLGEALGAEDQEEVPDWARALVDEHLASTEGEEGPPALPEGAKASGPEAEAASGEEELIPDWMKEAGWEPREGPLEEPPSAEGEEPEEEGLAPAEIPDWLQELKPPEAEAEETEAAEATSEEGALPWLQEETPGASETVITWLQEHAASSETPPAEPAEVDEEGLPEWLRDLEEPGEAAVAATEGTQGVSEGGEEAPTAESEVPDWLKELEAEESAPAPEAQAEVAAEAEASAAEGEVPEWLQELEAAEPEAQAEAPAAEGETAPVAEGPEAAEGPPLDADEALA